MPIKVTRFKIHCRIQMIAAVALAAVAFVTSSVQSCFAQRQQKTFSSAEAAASALFVAAQSRDESALMDVLGSPKEAVSTGDDIRDKLEREQFVQKYHEMHRLVHEPDKTTVLYLGAENWPFPIPLVSNHGVWRFDSQAGMNEVLCRRIGENEAMAIGAFRLLTLAEQEYALRISGVGPEYTTHFIEASGAADGLHLKDNSPLPVGLARAGIDGSAAKDNSAVPFYGYYFRVLTAQGKHAPGGAKSYISEGKLTSGFAFIAYPASYRSSGVKTFIADSEGNVYEKDLGPETANIAKSMTVYDPDPSWHIADQDTEDL
jgi:Protein of unknown function (DUF2950)